MEKKKSEEDKSSLSNWFLTQDESKKIYTHFGGCMALIFLFALLLYWFIERLKAW